VSRKPTYKGKPPELTRCPRCGGTGLAPGAATEAVRAPFGTKIQTCGECHGRGKVIHA
jgi:DnaJ-class molecular chaperone